jgi:holo-[acyl-carrier protein] synthase
VIISSGIDIIEVKRIKKSAQNYGKSFLEKVFTAQEISYAQKKRNPYEHLAARFAAKEAVVKAFGQTDAKPIDWREIEIINRPNGCPKVKLHGELKKRKDKLKISEIIVSLSHIANFAVASAILVKER